MGKPNLSGSLVCKGATCMCSMAPGSTVSMNVITNMKHAINDDKGFEKFIATDKETTVASLNFGTCKPGTNSAMPCAAQLKWNGFYKDIILENGGSPLVDSSTATCSVGGGSITIINHGQSIAAPSNAQMAAADEDVHAQINPLVVLEAVENWDVDMRLQNK